MNHNSIVFRAANPTNREDLLCAHYLDEKEFRGKGIGTSLLNFIEVQARANGSTRLSLDVAAKNVTARRLYEHHGMMIESRWPKRIPISEIRFYRMTKVL